MDQDQQNQQPSPTGDDQVAREEENTASAEAAAPAPAAEEPAPPAPAEGNPSEPPQETVDPADLADDILEEHPDQAVTSEEPQAAELEREEPSEPAPESLSESGMTQEQIVEAILFSSDNPLPAAKIATVVGALSAREIRALVEKLNANYVQWNSAFRIQEIAGGFQMLTRPEFATYLQQLHKVRSESKLSPASLETLAIVAYKQPVLRAEIEAIRGVACGETLRTLMEKDLVKIVGRAEELGRPMLYGTTKKFMQVFGLASLEDLPKVPELLPPKAPPAAPPPAPANIDEIKTSQEPPPAPPAEAPAEPAAPADTEE